MPFDDDTRSIIIIKSISIILIHVLVPQRFGQARYLLYGVAELKARYLLYGVAELKDSARTELRRSSLLCVVTVC